MFFASKDIQKTVNVRIEQIEGEMMAIREKCMETIPKTLQNLIDMHEIIDFSTNFSRSASSTALHLSSTIH